MSFFIIDQIGYELESKTLFRNMTTAPDSARKRIINDLIKGLKADGTWNLLDTLWLMAAHDQQGARLNWKNPGTYTLTEVNSPTWTANQGYTGNGTDMYLSTNVALDALINYVRDSASFGVYSRSNVDENKADISVFDAVSNGISLQCSNATGDIIARINSATNMATTATADSFGLFAVARTGANNEEAFKNGVSVVTGTTASIALPALNTFILARNTNGVANVFSTKQLSMAFLGGGGIDQLKLYNRIQTYMTRLGTQV